MDHAQRIEFIANCELADCKHSLAEHVARMAGPSSSLIQPHDRAASAEAAVTGGSLVAFTAGMSRQNKEDVMDSFLFASLYAHKKVNAESQSEQWYKVYNEMLRHLGWVGTRWSYSRYQTSQQRFTMEQAGAEIIKSAIMAAAAPGPASLAMLAVARDALTALSAEEGPLRLFERQTKTHRGGNFRLASCTEIADGSVIAAMAAVAFQSNLSATNVLFWEWDNSDVQIYKGENYLEFNSRHYARHRETVRQKLADIADQAIMEFEI
jgi:hypothetical protein